MTTARRLKQQYDLVVLLVYVGNNLQNQDAHDSLLQTHFRRR